LYTSYKASFPADTPSYKNDADTVQAQKNLFFQNYMNNRLGYNKQAWEYLRFMDTCAAHVGDTATSQQCSARTIADIFYTTGKDTMSDIRATPDGGVIMVGRTTRGAGALDAYIIRYDSSSNIQWAKTYGGIRDDRFNKVRVTSDNARIGTFEVDINRIGDNLFNVGGDSTFIAYTATDPPQLVLTARGEVSYGGIKQGKESARRGTH